MVKPTDKRLITHIPSSFFFFMIISHHVITRSEGQTKMILFGSAHTLGYKSAAWPAATALNHSCFIPTRRLTTRPERGRKRKSKWVKGGVYLLRSHCLQPSSQGIQSTSSALATLPGENRCVFDSVAYTTEHGDHSTTYGATNV